MNCRTLKCNFCWRIYNISTSFCKPKLTDFCSNFTGDMFKRSAVYFRRFARQYVGITAAVCSVPILFPLAGRVPLGLCEPQAILVADAAVISVTNDIEAVSEGGNSEEGERQPGEQEVAQIEITDEECDINDPEWLAEKEKCSFCTMFIASPCFVQFKKWSMCVDKAKESNADYTAACTQYTRALMSCTSDNADYFEAVGGASDDVEEDDGLIGEPVRDDEK
jgi:hypothetical protein